VIVETLPELNRDVKSIAELTRSEIKEIAIGKIKERILAQPQQDMFAEDVMLDISSVYEQVVTDYTRQIIEIPRISMVQKQVSKAGFHGFDLDTGKLSLQPVKPSHCHSTTYQSPVDGTPSRARVVVSPHRQSGTTRPQH
jgi:type III restriction enzyme